MLVALADVARLLGVSDSHCRSLIRAGTIPACRLSSRVYVKRADLVAYIDGLAPVLRRDRLFSIKGKKAAHDAAIQNAPISETRTPASPVLPASPARNPGGRQGSAPEATKRRPIFCLPIDRN
jgi:excisionase family DNA binding protein